MTGRGKSGWQMSLSGRPKSMPPGDVTGSEAGLDMRRRREPEVRRTSRDFRQNRFDVNLKPASSAARKHGPTMRLITRRPPKKLTS